MIKDEFVCPEKPTSKYGSPSNGLGNWLLSRVSPTNSEPGKPSIHTMVGSSTLGGCFNLEGLFFCAFGPIFDQTILLTVDMVVLEGCSFVPPGLSWLSHLFCLECVVWKAYFLWFLISTPLFSFFFFLGEQWLIRHFPLGGSGGPEMTML